eukprot:gene17127-biopygen21852
MPHLFAEHAPRRRDRATKQTLRCAARGCAVPPKRAVCSEWKNPPNQNVWQWDTARTYQIMIETEERKDERQHTPGRERSVHTDYFPFVCSLAALVAQSFLMFLLCAPLAAPAVP